VPRVALELRLVTELYRNRQNRVEALIQFMQAHGCALDCIRRGIASTGLPQTVQKAVLNKLKPAPYKKIATLEAS
jgi:hypothetical protein